jgi:4-amino-4-deoxy-L-arabinose transferase-like glycosyltransferase
VAAPWYVAILLDHGSRFVDVFLLNHNVERFTSTIHHHPGEIWYYLPVLLVGLFPWSGLAVPGLFGLRPRAQRADLFLLLWLALPLAFLSVAASKLPGYILPCVPPLALVMGRAADRLVSTSSPESQLSGRVTALVGLVLGALMATVPAFLAWLHEPFWRSALAPALWALLAAFLFSRRVGPDPEGALRGLRIGAAGLLVLLALAAPPLLAHRQSGKALFLPARGHEVLAWGAWRTSWMAGYFYNDGHVRVVRGAREVLAAARREPALVIAGPPQRQRLATMDEVETQVLARGPRDDALVRVGLRPPP